MLRLGLFLGVGLLLAACSTSVTFHQPMPAEMLGNIRVAQIAVTPGNVAPPMINERLKSAVELELTKRASGATPITLVLQVTEFSVKDQNARLLGGAFAGSYTNGLKG